MSAELVLEILVLMKRGAFSPQHEANDGHSKKRSNLANRFIKATGEWRVKYEY